MKNCHDLDSSVHYPEVNAVVRFEDFAVGLDIEFWHSATGERKQIGEFDTITDSLPPGMRRSGPSKCLYSCADASERLDR